MTQQGSSQDVPRNSSEEDPDVSCMALADKAVMGGLGTVPHWNQGHDKKACRSGMCNWSCIVLF